MDFQAPGLGRADQHGWARQMDVRNLLPEQPWKPGIQARISEQLGVSKKSVKLAIQSLIDTGVFNRQFNGVVYDRDDRIIAFDTERVGHIPWPSPTE